MLWRRRGNIGGYGGLVPDRQNKAREADRIERNAPWVYRTASYDDSFFMLWCNKSSFIINHIKNRNRVRIFMNHR